MSLLFTWMSSIHSCIMTRYLVLKLGCNFMKANTKPTWPNLDQMWNLKQACLDLGFCNPCRIWLGCGFGISGAWFQPQCRTYITRYTQYNIVAYPQLEIFTCALHIRTLPEGGPTSKFHILHVRRSPDRPECRAWVNVFCPPHFMQIIYIFWTSHSLKKN